MRELLPNSIQLLAKSCPKSLYAVGGSVRDAFADPGRAILFFEKLVRGLATPIDLPYVLEDSMK